VYYNEDANEKHTQNLSFIYSQIGYTWIYNGVQWNNLRKISGGSSANEIYLRLFDNLQDIHVDEQKNLWVIENNQIYRIRNTTKITDDITLAIRAISNRIIGPLDPGDLVLEYDNSALRVSLLAPDFLKEGSTEFQYILEGLMKEWSEWNRSGIIEFPFLPEGDYTFKVRAKNVLGQISEVESFEFAIRPPFWRTAWFYLLCLLGGAGILFGLMRLRERHLKLQRMMLEEKIRIRTQQFKEQKDRAETLLLNILPRETAEELKTKGKFTARYYDRVSVLFTDFKGFTKSAEKLSPQMLVQELDKYFRGFDDIVTMHNVEKIKTIGDSYMCAGGITMSDRTNPVDMVLVAMDIQRFMMELITEKKKGEDVWELRIGLHTGPLIAGVVGKSKFAYDIWGDTVNTASRMESGGKLGKINISGTTYDYVKDFFDCEHRGKVKVKGKGETDMYFVDRIKKKLSIDGEGVEPNAKFKKLLREMEGESDLNYDELEQYVVNRLEKELPKELHYHSVNHTIDVRQAIERIARQEGVKGDELLLVKTAALFHDMGFLEQYDNNEERGAEIAREILPNYDYNPLQINIVCAIIMATQMPQNPQTRLEEIMCDADLDYLGRKDYDEIADLLLKEMHALGNEVSKEDWNVMQVEFLKNHVYFTDTNKEAREKAKAANLKELEAQDV